MLRLECTSDRLHVLNDPSAACRSASGAPALWFSFRWGKELERLAHYAVGDSEVAVADVMFPGYPMLAVLLLQRRMQPQIKGNSLWFSKMFDSVATQAGPVSALALLRTEDISFRSAPLLSEIATCDIKDSPIRVL